jgi:hypothetical protein
LVPILDAAEQERWAEVSHLLAEVRGPYEVSYVSALVNGAEMYKYICGLGSKATGLQLAMRAKYETQLAWEARSTQRAEFVNEWQWRAFREGLVKSERLLLRLIADDPDNALAWEARIVNSRGLELGHSETRRRYDRLAAIAPHHRNAQMYTLVQFVPKWGGSWEAAHDFARECAQASPPGSLNAELIASYYAERWMDTRDNNLLRGKDVAEELMAAAQQSVLHKDFERPYGWVPALSTFAFLFCLADDYAAAAPFFRAMGDLGSQSVWALLPGDPARNFVKYRDRALAKG